MPAEPILDPLDRARGRPQHGHAEREPRLGCDEPLRDASREGRDRDLIEPARHDVHEPQRRWVGRALAGRHLLGDEPQKVVRRRVPHRMVSGDARLDHDLSALRSAAGAPRDLTEQLEGPLARAEVGEVDPHVGVDHPHEGDVGEVETLGDHLRAEQHVDFATADAIEDRGVRPLAGRGVHVHARDPRRGKPFHEQSLHLLRAEPALTFHGRTAVAAGAPRRFLMQAVMTDEALGGAMIGERDRAVGATRHVPVGALDERRVATPVEQEDALLPPREPFAETAFELGRYHLAARPLVGRGRAQLLPQVEDAHLRQPTAAHTLRQREQGEPPILRVLPALEARRRTAQHAARARLARADECDVAGVVAWRLRLLVARLVLFVDDDRTEVRERCEDRRPRADRDPLLAASQGAPRIEPLAVAQSRVEDRDLVTEHRPEAIDSLRRERDLRDENDRALAVPAHDLLEDLQVHERLAAPGDAVQQEGGAGGTGEDRVDRSALCLARRDLRRLAGRPARERIARSPLALLAHESPLEQARHHAAGTAQALEEERHRSAPAELLEELVELPLLRCTFERGVTLEERGQFLGDRQQSLRAPFRCRTRGDAEGGGQHGTADESERHHVVVRDPAAEREQVGTERWQGIGNVEDRLGNGLAERDAVALPHAEPDGAPIAHRHHHAAPGHEWVARRLRHRVGEGLQQRQRERDLDEARAPRRGGGGHSAGRDPRTGGSSCTPSVPIQP